MPSVKAPIGLYVHIPFCASKCGYCDFYSKPSSKTERAAYLPVLLGEIRSYQGKGIRADTLFIGGGTPSILEAAQLGAILSACREVFAFEGECTLEANPDSVSEAFLSAVREAGFNRISFGAQSAKDRELRALGRRHDASRIGQAVGWAREAGFLNLSLDVMVGIPGQDANSLQETLAHFVSLSPEHMSCYLLKIEEGTQFYKTHAERLCADEDEAADLYLQTVDALQRAGYMQYEISNFSVPGRECIHNLKYWECKEYLSFGPAAHSYFDGERFYHPRGLASYLESGGTNLVADGPGGTLEEQILLGMRLRKGIDCKLLQMDARSQNALLEKTVKFTKMGLMERNGTRVSFTPEGFLLSNTLLAELLSCQEVTI